MAVLTFLPLLDFFSQAAAAVVPQTVNSISTNLFADPNATPTSTPILERGDIHNNNILIPRQGQRPGNIPVDVGGVGEGAEGRWGDDSGGFAGAGELEG